MEIRKVFILISPKPEKRGREETGSRENNIERRNALLREKKKKQEEMLRKDKEKKERKAKQKDLQTRWEMMRWVATYLG